MAITLKLPSKRLKIDDIIPNEDNPRKDLGDLTELIESVKENGVMQNLTVFEKTEKDIIPSGNKPVYVILMGHRRHAAAKAAGLTHLFCQIIEEPTKEEQLHIMLQENIQRNDLTILEEADAFSQLHFDLGESVQEISKKTGLGETTIRRRIKIGELDKEAVKKANSQWQLSLLDYSELERIEDINKRNLILGSAYNSNDLKWKVDRAIREEKDEAVRKELTDTAFNLCPALKNASSEKKYWELTNSSRYKKVAEYRKGKEFSFQPEEDARYHMYFDFNYGSFSVYKEIDKKEEPEEDELEAKRDEYIERSSEELEALIKEGVEKVLIALNTKSVTRDLSEDNWMDMAMYSTIASSGGVSIENIWKGIQKAQKESGTYWWNLSKQEKEDATKEILAMTLAEKIRFYLVNWFGTINWKVYNLEPPLGARPLSAMIDILYMNTSFVVDDNVIEAADGSHELYTIPEELQEQDDEDEDEDEEDDDE